MRFKTSKEFRDWRNKAVTVFGMSGVGKTTLADMLQAYNWFHYSVDYRIGTRYMGEHIVDNFKREAMRVTVSTPSPHTVRVTEPAVELSPNRST